MMQSHVRSPGHEDMQNTIQLFTIQNQETQTDPSKQMLLYIDNDNKTLRVFMLSLILGRSNE